jgi:hypothetical protein
VGNVLQVKRVGPFLPDMKCIDVRVPCPTLDERIGKAQLGDLFLCEAGEH